MTSRSSLLNAALLIGLAIASASSTGCMSKRAAVSLRTGGEAMPVVEVKPGYVERIALMDKYRLHDEMRKHMQQRPRIWVEEVPDDELSQSAQPAEGEEAQPEEPQPQAIDTTPPLPAR